jgi:hypothetical protein
VATPEPSILAPLIETALGMANAGLARVFANAIGSALASEATRTLRDGVASAAVKESAKKELAAISEPIREGFKSLGKKQISNVKDALAGKEKEKGKKDFGGFFEVQSELLAEQRQAARQLLTEKKYRLKPLLKTSPDVALVAQRTAQHGLEAAVAHARQQQLMSSVSQFLVAVASSQSRDPDALSDRLAYARDFGADNPHRRGIRRADPCCGDRSALAAHRPRIRAGATHEAPRATRP